MRFSALAAFLVAFSMFATIKTASAANDLVHLENELEQLRTANEIALMIVPRGVSYRSRITKDALPKASCVYQISTSGGTISNDAINTLRTGLIEYEKGAVDIGEVRIGIFFKSDIVSHEFYFQDWDGKQKVRGTSGEYRILASADLPDRLRDLVSRPGAILISDAFGGCARS